MPRRVIIDGRLIGYRHGGIANYARQLAEHVPAIAADMDIQLLTRHDVPCLSERSIRSLTPPHHRLERYALGLELMARKPALVHSTDYVQPVYSGLGSVVTVHDLAFMSQPGLLTGDSLRFYRNVVRSVREADRVIAVSDWTRSQVKALLDVPEERIRLVPNGYDPERFHPDAAGDRAQLRRLHPDLLALVDEGRPLVCAVGTIEPRKRFGILLSAFEHIDQYVDTEQARRPLLVVAGQTGWMAETEIRQLRELQRSGHARWLRDISDRELAALYRASSLLVMPSADEGFGLPVLEAMACGTPALVAANGALPELVSDAGFIEERDEPELWAKKVAAILGDDEIRERRARRGRSRAEGYTWRETARLTTDVYREVLSER